MIKAKVFIQSVSNFVNVLIKCISSPDFNEYTLGFVFFKLSIVKSKHKKLV